MKLIARTEYDGQGAPTKMIGSVQDVSAEHALLEQIRHNATHDHLTELSNRSHFFRRICDVLSDSRPSDRHALLFVDLDHFKDINDAFGCGLLDTVTGEAHFEGGNGLENAGVGADVALCRWGIASLALAGSRTGSVTGAQASASVKLQFDHFALFGTIRGTLGNYQDIASVTARKPDGGDDFFDPRPPKALKQIAVSFPLKFDPAALSLSYTELTDASGVSRRIGSLSLSRTFPGGAAIYANAFAHFEGHSFGAYVGLSMPLGGGVREAARSRGSLSMAAFLHKPRRFRDHTPTRSWWWYRTDCDPRARAQYHPHAAIGYPNRAP